MGWINFILLGFGIPGYVVGWLAFDNPWMGFKPGLLIVFALFGFAFGSLVGSSRGRTWQASWLGLILGPCGWLITLALPKRSEK